MCRRVEARAIGCWTTCSMYASGPSIATRSNHNILLQYRTYLYLSVSFIISISFCFCLLFLHFIGRIWTTLYNPQRLFHNVKFEGSNGRIFKSWLLFLDLCKLVHTNSRGQEHYCNLLTKHPHIGTIRSNFLYPKTCGNICCAILLLV